MTRGGKREGAGRPKGTKKEPTLVFYKRVTKEEYKFLTEQLENFRKKEPKQ
jgi:hypothetical protein